MPTTGVPERHHGPHEGRARRWRRLVMRRLQTAAMVSALALLAASPQVASGAEAGVLSAGDALSGGESLLSENGRYRLNMQTDGNLTLTVASSGKVLWNARSNGNPGAQLRQQTDGNSVVYATDGRVLWTSQTAGNPGARLEVQDDANLVSYSPNDAPLWFTGTHNSTLVSGEVLRAGESLISPSGRYALNMQPDGNLTATATASGKVLWDARTNGNSGARLVQQSDGNAVVYAADGRVLWNSGTAGHAGARLQIQSDSNLVSYSASDTPLWFTGTHDSTLVAGETLRAGQSQISPSGRYALNMQGDGNLTVTVAATGNVVWDARTNGNPGARLVQQSDGNAVIYAVDGRAVWNSRTAGHPGAAMHVQDDSNLVVYAANRVPLWFTGITAPAPSDPRAQRALDWARGMLGSTAYDRLCERFVEVAYGTSGRYATAWAAAQAIGLNGGDPREAPAGALMYFAPDASNGWAGHAGLSLGNGEMISGLSTVRIDAVHGNSYWSGLYRGWATAPASWPGR